MTDPTRSWWLDAPREGFTLIAAIETAKHNADPVLLSYFERLAREQALDLLEGYVADPEDSHD